MTGMLAVPSVTTLWHVEHSPRHVPLAGEVRSPSGGGPAHLDTHRRYTVRRTQKRLCPLLPDFIETSLFKIIRSHDHPKFYICVESEEPWFSKGGNL